MSVRSKPNREVEVPAEPECDESWFPSRTPTRGAAFVPSGTPDNSPPFQRWDGRRKDKSSPGRDERTCERDAMMMAQQPIPLKCLSPLWGFLGFIAPRPTDESVGY